MKPKTAQNTVPPKVGLKAHTRKKKTMIAQLRFSQKGVRPKAGFKACGHKNRMVVEISVPDAAKIQHVLKISEARKELPQMVYSVGSGEAASFVVGPYGKPSAALVSYERFRPLLAQGTKGERFAMLIVDELLEDAPTHLWVSAIRELSALPKSDLTALWKLTAASSDDEIAAIRKRLGHPDALDRLVIRMRVASAISDAREAGVYDEIEDATADSLTADREA